MDYSIFVRKGSDAGDHPPITPMKAATESELGHENWKLYDYITRHFIATVCVIVVRHNLTNSLFLILTYFYLLPSKQQLFFMKFCIQWNPSSEATLEMWPLKAKKTKKTIMRA